MPRVPLASQILLLISLIISTSPSVQAQTNLSDDLGTVDCKSSDFNSQIQHLQMSLFDAWVFVVVCSLAFIIQIIFISMTIKIKRLRAQPGDLLFGSFCAEAFLSLHWLASGMKRILDPDTAIDSNGAFCIINSTVSIMGGLLSAFYNVTFFLFIGASVKNSLSVKGISRLKAHVGVVSISTMSLLIMFGLGLNGKTLYGTCSFAAGGRTPIAQLLIYIFVLPFAILSLYFFNKKIPNTTFYRKQRRQFLSFVKSYLISILIIWGVISVCSTLLFLNCSYFHQSYFTYFRSIGNILKVSITISLPVLRFFDPYVLAIFKEQSTLLSIRLFKKAKESLLKKKSSLKADDKSTIIQKNNNASAMESHRNIYEMPSNYENTIGISPGKKLVRKVLRKEQFDMDDTLFEPLHEVNSQIQESRQQSVQPTKVGEENLQDSKLSDQEIERRITAFEQSSKLKSVLPFLTTTKSQIFEMDLSRDSKIKQTCSDDVSRDSKTKQTCSDDISRDSKIKQTCSDDLSRDSTKLEGQSLEMQKMRTRAEISRVGTKLFSINGTQRTTTRDKSSSIVVNSNFLNTLSTNFSMETAPEYRRSQMKKISLFKRTITIEPTDQANNLNKNRQSIHKTLISEQSRKKLQMRLFELFRESSYQEEARGSSMIKGIQQPDRNKSMWRTVLEWSDEVSKDDEEEAVKEKVQNMLKNAQLVDYFSDPFYRVESRSDSFKEIDQFFGREPSSSSGAQQTKIFSTEQLQADAIVDAKEHFVRTLQRNIKMGVLCRIICGIQLHIMRKNNFCSKLDLFVEGMLPQIKQIGPPKAPRPSRQNIQENIQKLNELHDGSSRRESQQISECADTSKDEILTFSEGTEVCSRQQGVIDINNVFTRSSNGTICPISENIRSRQSDAKNQDDDGDDDNDCQWLFKESKVYQFSDDSIKTNLKCAPTQLLESDPFDMVKMRVYAPLVFHSLLRSDSATGAPSIQDSFNLQYNLTQIRNSSGSDGGKSGQFFFFSYDNKFLLKTVTASELKILVERLKAYFQHLKKHPRSLIAKIFGIYSFEGLNENPIHLILMKNIAACKKEFIERTYDLKGSTFDRAVLNKEYQSFSKSLSKYILKDTDFLLLERFIYVSRESRLNIFKQLETDSKFFASQGLIDYSLIIFKINRIRVQQHNTNTNNSNNKNSTGQLQYLEEEEDMEESVPEYFQYESSEQHGIFYHIGIIDYLQLYTIQKRFEKYTKRIINLSPFLDTSSQDPETYSNRFISLMRKILGI